jgi:hypothetical protein
MINLRQAHIVLNGEKLKLIFSKVRKETRMSISPALIQYSATILSQSSKAREMKGIQVGKEEVNYSSLQMNWSYI